MHMRALHSLLGIQWQERIANLEVPDINDLPNTSKIKQPPRFADDTSIFYLT